MSTHKIEVVRIGEIKPHTNADSLGMVDVWGYTCAVRLGEWKAGDLAAYIPPDYIVPDTEPFAFLKGHRRIRPVRLRGLWSQGLLMPAPDGAAEGDDVMGAMGIERYEAPEPGARGWHWPPDPNIIPAPPGHWPVYDVEAWRRYHGLLVEGEPVIITEKIHGASARFVWLDRLHVGSRRNWFEPASDAIWARLDRETAWIAEWCQSRPGVCLYGEVYGQVRDQRYDTKAGELRFAAFDAWDGAAWLPIDAVRESCAASVPLLYRGPYEQAAVVPLSEGKSTIASHAREGCVVRTVPLRWSAEVGDVQLKCVGNDYLSRAK